MVHHPNTGANTDRKEQGSTRQSILRLLRHRGQMTATELSQELNIGAVGVRQHLALLERDNLVEVAGLRRNIGRPSHLYTLTQEAEQCFPKSYDRLAINVLNHLADQGGEEAVTAALTAHRQALNATFAARITGTTPEERVRELVAVLNEHGYMTEYEKREDAFVLTTYNCPVDCVAHQYHQICVQELELFQELIGLTLIREASIGDGDVFCRYTIPVHA